MTKVDINNQCSKQLAHRLTGLPVLAAAFLYIAGLTSAYASMAGHWQGTIEIPDKTVQAIIDLDRDDSGAWIGSVSIPQLNVNAVPLADITVTDTQVSFSIVNALSDSIRGPATFQAQDVSAEHMSGHFTQAGNRARFVMQRTGNAHVALPPRSTMVAKELAGTWVGEFIGIGGYARHVTLTLRNQGKAGAVAEFIVVGKQTTNVPIDLVTYAESLLTLKSSSTEINFEGRYNPSRAEISGMFELGAFEFPLVLQRRKQGDKP